ncbi:putative WRKY transcription factor 2 [Triticum urartu]|uniref:Putative WRKY transcription factor 2 n=1 Tax=Triticum urartu TaxID=4572 RepID=M7YVD2_TRIUA|nr:putative WRKY transcription factor 2 [Triticum urartu]
MAGASNRRGAVMEDWMLSTPSPRTLMLSLFNDDFSSGPFSDVSSDSGSNKPHDGMERSKASVGSSPGESSQVTKTSLHFEPNLFDANEKSSPDSGSPAERNGFCALKIDTSRVGFSASIRSPIIIPPGAQPSPTTGKLPFLMRTNANTTIPSVHKKAQELSHDDHTISFQQILRSKPTFSFVDKGPSVTHHNQPLASENNHRIPDNEQEDSKANRNGDDSPATIIVRAEDGYNWRKYGKKQVKNSEHPTSYYKCSHQNCPVKKKVERCQDGDITEIVYKGSHNHPLLPPDRRPSVPFSHSNDLQADGEENALDDHFQHAHGEVPATNLSASLNREGFADRSATREAIDVSPPTLSGEDNNREAHGTVSSGIDRDQDVTESKRMMMDYVTPATAIGTIDIGALASRAVREARVIVQTTSEVDVLDDGYCWRKYGQKVVKGNPNPRSYYKCTHPSCPVRKHVERASNDLKSVITTYEGKHTHEVPADRNNGYPSSGHGDVAPLPQANGLHWRSGPAQGGIIPQYSGAAAYGSLAQLGVAGGFPFGMLPRGLALVPVPAQMMAGHPSAMQGNPRLVLQAREVKGNPAARPADQSGTGPAAYQQLMSRLSQGPNIFTSWLQRTRLTEKGNTENSNDFKQEKWIKI